MDGGKASRQQELAMKILEADFQENLKAQVRYVLDLPKQLMPDPSFSSLENPRCLPTYTTLFLCHALRTIFYHSSFLHPLTSRCLLLTSTAFSAMQEMVHQERLEDKLRSVIIVGHGPAGQANTVKFSNLSQGEFLVTYFSFTCNTYRHFSTSLLIACNPLSISKLQ